MIERRIRGLLFDFDGLLVDTETPTRLAWREAYEARGQRLPEDLWAAAVGTRDPFDPFVHLQEVSRQDLSDVAEQLAAREAELVRQERLRPGAAGWIEDARARGLRLAVVSSSTTAWVREHLDRLGIGDRWDGLFCADDDPSSAKPSPFLYRSALDALDLEAGEAVALEDSPNGIAAASAAGVFVVAVPNPVTQVMDLSGADLFLASLADLRLGELLARLEGSFGG